MKSEAGEPDAPIVEGAEGEKANDNPTMEPGSTRLPNGCVQTRDGKIIDPNPETWWLG